MRNHLAFKHLQVYERMLEDETSVKKSKAELVNIFSNIRAVKIGLNGCSFCPVKQKINDDDDDDVRNKELRKQN